ncbi:antitoxin component HigA of HigAB toxin-antitoxin module [Novosphingobium chloroacetimidivorans]|uniref:Antitoxin component HigA of HigAB toxin-antitoxin module n=1 Tax=Novosphingobium chloroacetimidivorans TaxID=1428314 RepID=A0A7W7KCR4_9SPHN|nr:hypothetical protein [Novosphingobium chloroacetimidivorans]MBB4860381.1 antitoxin component HigA of HigAB toxin-antitoxin module [Novosphingobium chloroacetimidivorans]
MEYYFVYSRATGEILARNSGPEGASLLGSNNEERGNFVVPYSIWDSYPVDLDGIKAVAAARLDQAAEAFRLQFITPGAAQAMTYQTKAAEAVAYLADDTAPVPFLSAEAQACGMTVADLALEVSARAASWTVIGAQIEALRMSRKLTIQQAANLAEIAQAMVVDWSAAVPDVAN